jgi:uncharacterized protein
MDPRISIITLGVSDLEKTRNFYQNVLKLPLSKNSSSDIAFFELKSIWLALFPAKELAEDANVSSDGSGFRKFTLAHNVRLKAEVDSLLNDVKAAGGEITRPARDTEWGGYDGYFKDPDGNLWEIAWNPQFWIE